MPEELEKGFGYWTILALAIGSILGTTIFFGAPIGAKYSGNLLIVAWIILSLIALYIAGVFGELTSMFPKAGGAYEFSKQAYGKFFSFVIAWTAWIFGTMSTVAIIIAAVNSLGFEFSTLESLGLSIGLIVLLNFIALFGVQVGSLVLIILGIVMVGIPLLVIFKAFPFINLDNFKPFATHNYSSIFVTLFFMAEAYFGWESATYLAEETKNPRKNIPKALMHGTAIIGILGLLMIFVTLGIIPWNDLINISSPISEISSRYLGSTIGLIITIGIFIALLGTAAATILSMPRLLLALARDKLFLGQFKELHPKFKTPYKAIIFQTVALIIGVFLGFANYIVLLELLMPIAAVLYIAMVFALVKLRLKMPNEPRSFKLPFVKVGSSITLLFFLVIIFAWLFTVPGASIFFQTSISLILLAVPLYLLVELYYDPKMITEATDLAAYASFLSQKITGAGWSTRKNVLDFLGTDLRGKTVLEYGCGVGSLTLKLLDAVGPNGSVYATHFAKNNIKITRKRVNSKLWESNQPIIGTAKIIHDPEQMKRVSPQIPYADAVVSIGVLGYIQDIKKVLAELYAIMPLGGKICFVEHTNFYHLLPNVEWMTSSKKIEALFREQGFSVKVVVKKGLPWNTVYVYGIRYSSDTVYV